MASEPRNVWNTQCELGEGPVWVERDQALWFVDIKKKHIHRLDPASGDKRSWDAPEMVGFILPAKSGGFVAGLQSGLHKFDETDGSFTPIAELEADLPANRLNDAVTDPSGTMWFGSMDNDEKADSGAFYRFVNGRVEPTELTGICITNGPAVSPDGRILYYIDTLAKTIRAADIADDGSLSNYRLFAAIADGEGYPDGPTIDSEGHLWVSLYDGWETRRYSPAGDIVQRVRLPAANITKIAFGGPDLRTVFATSARQGMSAEALEQQQQAGDLFSFQVEVAGVPCPLVRY
ncbi:MAG: SMP-30/gluconolactonase/LRE family protein [Sphingomicrobium sp.]